MSAALASNCGSLLAMYRSNLCGLSLAWAVPSTCRGPSRPLICGTTSEYSRLAAFAARALKPALVQQAWPCAVDFLCVAPANLRCDALRTAASTTTPSAHSLRIGAGCLGTTDHLPAPGSSEPGRHHRRAKFATVPSVGVPYVPLR